jgi:hypothetical protein
MIYCLTAVVLCFQTFSARGTFVFAQIRLQHLYKSTDWLGFEVLTAVSTKMAVFWVVAPCSLVEVYQRFRGNCCLHHQGDDLLTG